MFILSTLYVTWNNISTRLLLTYVIGLSLFLFIIIASGSRQSVLVVVIVLSYILLGSNINLSTKIYSILTSIVVVATTLYYTWSFFVKNFILDSVTQIYEGSTRIKIYSEMYNIITNNPYTGSGIQTYRIYTKYYAHNGYLSAISDIGIPLFILGSGWTLIVLLYYFCGSHKKNAVLFVALIISLLVMVNLNDLLREQFLWVTFATAIYSAK
ncbi:O-antigen ligase family protein [Salinibacter ruber]|uniref:O-antigen ligase family protein n=1 Tax=Salinibacter ruber TaxID=146919 RepID=UPI003C6E44E6